MIINACLIYCVISRKYISPKPIKLLIYQAHILILNLKYLCSLVLNIV